eukprot:Opistho-2@69888
MNVVNAAIGWKQPNGFYYPPAFVFAKSAFSQNTLRHNVIDQYQLYGTGSNVAPVIQGYNVYSSGGNVTPLDATTILLDVDGTLTGAVTSNYSRTSSVSNNLFFDAPSVVPECNSYGVQTSPYDLVSTVMANIGPGSGGNIAFNVKLGLWGRSPIIPIYRQLTLPNDTCASPFNVCASGTLGLGCSRASVMGGTQTSQAPYLTMNHGVYYLDTNSQSVQSCCPHCFGANSATFTPNEWYMIWHVYASPNTKVKYQVHVGDGFNPATDGKFVRVTPHSIDPNTGSALETPVFLDASGADFSTDVAVVNGTLFLTLDHSKIASDYNFTARGANEKCIPRDVCQISADQQSCVASDAFTAKEPQLADEMSRICGYWASRAAGMYPGEQTTFADCPASGCLGYAFKMPTAFVPQPYASVGAKLTSCFPRSRSWGVSLKSTPGDASCPPPSPSSGYCPSPNTNAVPSKGADYPGSIVPGLRGPGALVRLFDFGEDAEGFGAIQEDSTDTERWQAAMQSWRAAFEEYKKSTEGQCA